MANRSRMSMLKRQREMKKNEKAARKRAKRHGIPEAAKVPTPTLSLNEKQTSTEETTPESSGPANG